MIAYKLFRVMKDGSISSLFINKKERYQIGKWMKAKNYPTKGYAERFGWHSTEKPQASHLSEKGRKWFKVDVGEDYICLERPINQGKTWYLSTRLKIIEEV